MREINPLDKVRFQDDDGYWGEKSIGDIYAPFFPMRIGKSPKARNEEPGEFNGKYVVVDFSLSRETDTLASVGGYYDSSIDASQYAATCMASMRAYHWDSFIRLRHELIQQMENF